MVVKSLDDPQVAAVLTSGGVAVLPTDTIYGLVACAVHPKAVARLYQLKERERKPGTMIAADLAQLIGLGLPPEALQQVAHLWPGPISIVLPAPPNLDYLDQGVGSLAVRLPQDPAVQALLRATGPLLTSSANLPGKAPADIIEDAQNYFGDQVALYVDGGDRSHRPPSTVARWQPGGVLEVLRQGAVTIDDKRRLYDL